jgi:ribose transport system substrate-binding protein
VDLLVLDNCYDPKTTLLNAERMIGERVDVAIEFQTFDAIAQLIGSKLQHARIPYVSIDMPSPGATYYGANNYQAGRLAGNALARWSRDHWLGEPELVLLLELPAAGPLVQLRSSGALVGIREVLPNVADSQVIHLDGANTFEGGLRVVRQVLRTSKARRVLVAASNDPNALGALTAFQEARRYEQCAVTGQGATLDARLELRRAETRLIGTVAYFPERYGKALIRLAMDLLARKPVPPAVYTKHRFVTPENVDRLYPHDNEQVAATSE